MPTIACSKVLTGDSFVCSLEEVTSSTDFWSSVDIALYPTEKVSWCLYVLFVNGDK